MDSWLWLLCILIPSLIILIFIVLFIFIKRNRGHGYFLSKFSAFTRVRFDHLEQRRQTYCPADKKCQCHTKHSSSHIEPNLSCTHRSPTLYMSFAGAAMIVGGVRTTEWRSSISKLHDHAHNQFDVLFLTDPAQCFYLQDPNYQWDGLKYCRKLVKLYSTLYQRVILIGASLGGSMVCMCADLATISIAFNPILDPTLLGLPWRIMGAYCSARQAHVIREQVKITMEKINSKTLNRDCVLHIHWSQLSAADRRQAHRIIRSDEEKKSKQTKCLTSVLDFDIDSHFMNSLTGVHVWFHSSGRHALAMHLKRADQLVPLLRRHLYEILENCRNNTSQEGQQSNTNHASLSVKIHEIDENDVLLALV
ncbi:unnamed protein product [Rotaria socialis]|uniref:Uncharacterized protein n=1 Tax=Rotaria socialis TaxID=392032 RepID=A0A818IFT5_9BILA|nr:unnamed protein product [Rotaria socialis]CAF3521901.1 unnamed protein product [Rotaria socialis]CAF4360670.1 unnamed protein product [Rotaria socialis]CAF4394020.1 unnamed protein product [Rotaria socialis]